VGCYINDSENGLEIEEIDPDPYTILSLWGLFGVMGYIRDKKWTKRTFVVNGFLPFCWECADKIGKTNAHFRTVIKSMHIMCETKGIEIC
jgi:hypothetical protein